MADSPHIFEGTPENFEDLVIQGSHTVPVLVDFWADWCNPCQMLMPIVTHLAEDYQGKFRLVKVNSDEQQQLATQYGVRSLPTLKLFQNGQVVEEIMGAQSESVLRELLDKYVERESDQWLQQAMQLVENGDLAQARKILEQAHVDDPENQRIPLDLVRIVVMMGDYDDAQEMIKKLPPSLRDTPDTKILGAQIKLAKVIDDSPQPDELFARIEQDPDDLQSRYQLAAWSALNDNHESALKLLLEIMKKDRSWSDEAGRNGMLTVFDMLGGEGDLVSHYRRQMFNLLH